jgi:hypothetical protein
VTERGDRLQDELALRSQPVAPRPKTLMPGRPTLWRHAARLPAQALVPEDRRAIASTATRAVTRPSYS